MECQTRNDGKNGINLFLYFAVITANITCFTSGIAFAWSSPVTPKLGVKEDNPLEVPLSDDEVSWLASLMPLGAAVGPFLGGYLADKIGRKQTLIVSSFPTILCSVLLAFGQNLYLYYVARFTIGMCVGICLTVVPMYVGEVAEIQNRGLLGCFTVFFLAIGSMYAFAAGPYIPLQWFNLSTVLPPAVFLVLMSSLIPESPCYLILKGKHRAAKRALKLLRRGSVSKELLDITETVKQSFADSGGIVDIFKSQYLNKALRVSAGLMIIQQSTAISCIMFYMQMIFAQSASSIPPEIAVIVIGLVQVAGTFTSTIIVEILGRKPLLLISTITTCIAVFVLSIYLYLLTQIDVSNIAWLPIATLVIYMFFYNIGIGPLPLAVMGEIFPPHAKSTASSLSVACCYLFSFTATKIFPFLSSLVGNWFAFLVFAISNVGGVVFIWRCVPETKGKTLPEILEFFRQ